MGKPNYETGDLIAVYWNGTYEVGEVWEATGEPEVSELVGWGWQTNVKRVAKRDPGMTLDELEVDPKLLGRRVQAGFDQHKQMLLEQGFGI